MSNHQDGQPLLGQFSQPSVLIEPPVDLPRNRNASSSEYNALKYVWSTCTAINDIQLACFG
jgi:hypothetical protein